MKKMSDLAKKHVAKIKPYVPGKPIEEVKREFALESVIKLASNENPLPPSPKVLKALRLNLDKINRYPDGASYYLKKLLAKKFGCATDNIIIGNGSDEIISFAVRAFVERDEEVIVSRPSFLMYEIAAQCEGVKIVTVPARNFRYDLYAMAERLTPKTKLIFIANPDNPLGTYVTRKELVDFLDRVGPGTIVFIDQAYFEFAEGMNDYPDGLEHINKKNVIVTRTFSKIYALAGLRVGYGFSNPDIIRSMEKIRDPFNVNMMAQVAAEAAIKDQAFARRSLKLISAGKKYLYGELARMGFEFIPSATNFMLINIMSGSNTKLTSGDIFQAMMRKGVIVREMGGWNLNGYIRVNVGTMPENRKFIKSLREVTGK